MCTPTPPLKQKVLSRTARVNPSPALFPADRPVLSLRPQGLSASAPLLLGRDVMAPHQERTGGTGDTVCLVNEPPCLCFCLSQTPTRRSRTQHTDPNPDRAPCSGSSAAAAAPKRAAALVLTHHHTPVDRPEGVAAHWVRGTRSLDDAED